MKIIRKLKSTAGESIAEVLIAVLIVVLAFLMFAEALIVASRVNAQIKIEDQLFEAATVEKGTINITFSTAADDEPNWQVSDVKLYETNNGYYYYEKD